MFFVMICGNGEEVKIFEGFFVPKLEQTISLVTPLLLRIILVVVTDVAAEMKNWLCFAPLRWRPRLVPFRYSGRFESLREDFRSWL